MRKYKPKQLEVVNKALSKGAHYGMVKTVDFGELGAVFGAPPK